MAQRKISGDEWERVRMDLARGIGVSSVAKHYGIGKSTVWRHAKAGGWVEGGKEEGGAALIEDVARAVAVMPVIDNASGVVSALANVVAREVDPKKYRSELVVQQVMSAAQVMRRQMQDWQEHREAYPYAIFYEEKDTGLRRAKLAADMLTARQAGERRAFGIIDDQVALREIDNAHEMTDAQLAEIIRNAGGDVNV